MRESYKEKALLLKLVVKQSTQTQQLEDSKHPTFAGLDPSMWYNPAHNPNPTLDREHQPFRHQNPNSNTMKIPILTLNPRHHPTRCRRCKEPDPDAAPGCDTNKHVYKFSFEYTPGAGR